MSSTPNAADLPNFKGILNGTPAVIYIPWKKDIFIGTSKVGQTSLQKSIGYRAQVPHHKLSEYNTPIAFIRDPLERLESAFNFFIQFGHFPGAWDGKKGAYTKHSPKTIERFIDLILDNQWYDKHWYVQSELWQVSDPVIEQFEDFTTVLRGKGVRIQHVNRTKAPKGGVTHRKEELQLLYQADFDRRR